MYNEIRETEHCWIKMPDGIRLAARIWWPQGTGPFPTVFEYIPYRKRDMVRARDERNHPYFAAHGYVCLRVDMRGSGDSEGHMPDMYAENELADARHVIDWLERQAWCNGRIGMFGTSWGGTASLQAAVEASGPLRAVIANCATANRFEDDIHWMGGGLLTDSFEWGATLPAILAAPPDAATVGEQWKEMWQKRLNDLSFPLDHWIGNFTRGHYWRHGSVLFSADKLSCPVLTIGGWADRYSNSVMRLVQARPDICWGIVGPWGHHYPDQGEPGPALSFQDLALTWWDHWLKEPVDADLNWPRLRLWRRQYDPPTNRLKRRSGRWIAINDTTEFEKKAFFLDSDGLLEHPRENPLDFAVPNNLRHGECAGDTGYFGRVGGLPLEQSKDDSHGLSFDSDVLNTDFDLLGHAIFNCKITRDQREAQLVCRLCEVTPEGKSHLVTRQLLNLALSQSKDEISAFSSGTPVDYCIRFPSTAYRFTKGNRVRLVIASSYWPLIWPTSNPASIQVLSRHARLVLPSMNATSLPIIPFQEVKQLPISPSWKVESAGPLQREAARMDDARATLSWHQPPITFHYPEIGLSIAFSTCAKYQIHTEDNSASCIIDYSMEIKRTDGNARIHSVVKSVSNQAGLSVEANLSVHWNSLSMAEKVWKYHYPPENLGSE